MGEAPICDGALIFSNSDLLHIYGLVSGKGWYIAANKVRIIKTTLKMSLKKEQGLRINDQVILEEDFDENYQPTEEEVFDYAHVIGIDPEKEPELLWIAREGITAPLPEHWKPCQDPSGDIYYFNFATGDSIWDHPCDEFYRSMVVEERQKAKLNAGKGKKASGKKEKLKNKNTKAEVAGLGPLKGATLSPQASLRGLSDNKQQSNLGPLKGELTPVSTMKSTLGGNTMKGSSLGPLRGSLGDSLIQTTNTGPRLSNEGFMRSSAEAYLRRSTDGSIDPRSSFLLGGTHSSLKSTSLDIDCESTAMSGILTGRDENIQLMADIPDDDEESDPLEKKFDLKLPDPVVGDIGYEDTDPSDPEKKDKSASESEESDFKEMDFGIDKNLSERVNMGIDMLTPAASNEFDLAGSHSLKSNMSQHSTDRLDPTGKSMSVIEPKKVVDISQDTNNDNSEERKRRADLAAQAAERSELMLAVVVGSAKVDADCRRRAHEDINKSADMLQTQYRQDLDDLSRQLEMEFEQEKQQLLKEKEDRLNKLREQIKKELEQEERRLKLEKEASLRKLRQQMKQEVEDEEIRLKETRDREMMELKQKSKDDLKEEEKKMRQQMDAKLARIREEVEELNHDEKARLEAEKKKILESVQTEVDRLERKQRADLERNRIDRLADVKSQLDLEVLEERGKLEYRHKECLEQLRKDLEAKHKKEMNDIRRELERHLAVEKETQEVELKAARERQMALGDLEHGLDDILKERRVELNQQHQRELERLKNKHQQSLLNIEEEYEDEIDRKKERIKDIKQQIETEFEKMKKEEAELKEKKNAIREELRSVQKSQREKLCKQHEEELNRLKEEHRRNIHNVEEQYRSELEQVFSAKRAEVKARQQRELEELQDQAHTSTNSQTGGDDSKIDKIAHKTVPLQVGLALHCPAVTSPVLSALSPAFPIAVNQTVEMSAPHTVTAGCCGAGTANNQPTFHPTVDHSYTMLRWPHLNYMNKLTSQYDTDLSCQKQQIDQKMNISAFHDSVVIPRGHNVVGNTRDNGNVIREWPGLENLRNSVAASTTKRQMELLSSGAKEEKPNSLDFCHLCGDQLAALSPSSASIKYWKCSPKIYPSNNEVNTPLNLHISDVELPHSSSICNVTSERTDDDSHSPAVDIHSDFDLGMTPSTSSPIQSTWNELRVVLANNKLRLDSPLETVSSVKLPRHHAHNKHLTSHTLSQASLLMINMTSDDDKDIRESPIRTDKARKTEKIHRKPQGAWLSDDEDDSFTFDEELNQFKVNLSHKSGPSQLRARLHNESNAIEKAKEFLIKRKHELKMMEEKHKNLVLEYDRDRVILENTGMSTDSKTLLADVKTSLDREALEIDMLKLNMSAGSRLLKEKQLRLKQLEQSIGEDVQPEDDDLDSFKPFSYKPGAPIHFSDLELTDSSDESSGISVTDYHIEDYMNLPQKIQTKPAVLPSAVQQEHLNDTLAREYAKLRREVKEVKKYIGYLGGAEKPGMATHLVPVSPMLSTRLTSDLDSGFVFASTRPTFTTAASAPTSNPFLMDSQHCLEFEPKYEEAERAIQRKWAKYFPDQKTPNLRGILPPGYLYSPASIRDQIKPYRTVYTDSVSTVTPASLSQNREWLDAFKKDLNRIRTSSYTPTKDSALGSSMSMLGVSRTVDTSSGEINIENNKSVFNGEVSKERTPDVDMETHNVGQLSEHVAESLRLDTTYSRERAMLENSSMLYAQYSTSPNHHLAEKEDDGYSLLPPTGHVRLELDENDELQVRHL
ncbi:hypothetical protein LSH36_287g01025 [Paralvinella palmiformis]|uniref:Centrosomal protein of 164 kDa n=1 Tax=Paralvinella palmiformis TaxID=53620 RepID=A0AAD9JJB6_9ANNE|nr:hypothetical protein LSH36_287g01025 [Paralvinella palmiformis]